MPKLKLTWETAHDNNVCPICKALEQSGGWEFEGGVDAFPQYLTFNGQIVWDTSRGSEAHEHFHNKAKCRCKINSSFDLSDILAKVEKLYQDVEAEYGGAPE